MNKTYFIIGGASATSLAIGGVGGYLLAKKKFDAKLDDLIALEVDQTKKHYMVLLAQAYTTREVQVERIVSDKPAAEATAVEEPEEEELSEVDKKTVARGKQALINYGGFADKPNLQDVVESNIFTKDAPKKKLPPRDPTGKFRPKQDTVRTGQMPYLISAEEFLHNDVENEQDSVRYFAGDETAVMESDYNDVVDNGRIGDDNLASFPEDEEPSVIYVRNEGLGIDYQITRTYESLTTAMGLGEDDDLDENDAAEYAHAHATDD